MSPSESPTVALEVLIAMRDRYERFVPRVYRHYFRRDLHRRMKKIKDLVQIYASGT